MTALTSSNGTTFTLSVPTNSSTNIGTVTTSSTVTGGSISVSNNNPSYGYCIHGNYYGTCLACSQAFSQQCSCHIAGTVCPIHSVTNTPNVNYCTCGQYNTLGCPIHLSGSITATPLWTTWPPATPTVDLHTKEGHRVSHEMVTDAKGLKIVFKCSFCNDVIYKKYIVRIPRKVREEKCLVRVLNHK